MIRGIIQTVGTLVVPTTTIITQEKQCAASLLFKPMPGGHGTQSVRECDLTPFKCDMVITISNVPVNAHMSCKPDTVIGPEGLTLSVEIGPRYRGVVRGHITSDVNDPPHMVSLWGDV